MIEEYLTEFSTPQNTGPNEPPCQLGRVHCWHGDYRQLNVSGIHGVCCWCGVRRVQRKNPAAHGSYDPSRERTYQFG